MNGHEKKSKRYTPVLVLILPGQEEKLKRAIQLKKGSSITFIKTDKSAENKKKNFHDNASGKYGTLLLTPMQVRKVSSTVKGSRVTVFFSKAQVQANARHSGGFLGALAAIIGTVLASTAAGAASTAISHAMSKGSGLDKQKTKEDDKCLIFHTDDGQCVRVTPETNGDGLWLRPYGKMRTSERHYMRKNGTGMYQRSGANFAKVGNGLTFGIY